VTTPQAGPSPRGDDPEEATPGLARERTALAWTRTALSFAVLGGAMLKVNVLTGLIILAIAPVVWRLGRATRAPQSGPGLPVLGATRLFAIAASVAAVSLLCLLVAIFGKSVPGALR